MMRVQPFRIGYITGLVFFFGIQTTIAQSNELGEGFFMPNTSQFDILPLYEIPKSRAGSQERPTDSISFIMQNGHAEGIAYAPKDFNPYHEKLDYGIFILKVKRLGRDFTEIVIDETTGKTAYVHTYSGNFMTWGEFLLNCHSVEFKDKNQKVFDNPMVKSAGRVVDLPYFRPRYIMGDWMEVALLDSNYDKELGKGWIRWRKDGKLLVTYNLFA